MTNIIETERLIQISPATRDEIHEIAAFLNESWKVEYRGIIQDDFLDSMPVSERCDGLLQRFDNDTSDFLTMRCFGKLIGTAVFGKSFTKGYLDDGEISAIYLQHDYIGKGYGHEFFTKVEETLALKGYKYFILDVLTDNLRAVTFYQKHGYEKVDEQTIKLGDKDYPITIFRKENKLCNSN